MSTTIEKPVLSATSGSLIVPREVETTGAGLNLVITTDPAILYWTAAPEPRRPSPGLRRYYTLRRRRAAAVERRSFPENTEIEHGLSAYVEAMAGTEADLDSGLEAAAAEHLLESDETGDQ